MLIILNNYVQVILKKKGGGEKYHSNGEEKSGTSRKQLIPSTKVIQGVLCLYHSLFLNGISKKKKKKTAMQVGLCPCTHSSPASLQHVGLWIRI